MKKLIYLLADQTRKSPLNRPNSLLANKNKVTDFDIHFFIQKN